MGDYKKAERRMQFKGTMKNKIFSLKVSFYPLREEKSLDVLFGFSFDCWKGQKLLLLDCFEEVYGLGELFLKMKFFRLECIANNLPFFSCFSNELSSPLLNNLYPFLKIVNQARHVAKFFKLNPV